MALWADIVGITGITRRCGGLWRFLIVWAKGRTALELERERNRPTTEVIQLLSGGDELLEYEPEGRLRIIRRAESATTSPIVIGETLPRPNGKLDP